jgi:hypothetical protein
MRLFSGIADRLAVARKSLFFWLATERRFA